MGRFPSRPTLVYNTSDLLLYCDPYLGNRVDLFLVLTPPEPPPTVWKGGPEELKSGPSETHRDMVPELLHFRHPRCEREGSVSGTGP